jgi:hypothetical protein
VKTSTLVAEKIDPTSDGPATVEQVGGGVMALLWLLVLLLIIFALVGGLAVNNWLFVILVIAIVLAIVGYG